MQSKSQKDSDTISVKTAVSISFLLTVISFVSGGIVFAGLVNNSPVSSTHRSVSRLFDDCVAGAPSDCVRGSIEQAERQDFRGFHYCACVTSSGLAKGYMAADSRVHRVDDTGARAERDELLGNDNPAVTFPVGARHR